MPPETRDHPILAVSTTNVFCLPGCPAPAPLPHHVEWLTSPRGALFSGYRPCLRCRPLDRYRGAVSRAELRRAELLRPLLAPARRVRQRRLGRRAVVLRLLGTPLGPMLAGVTDAGVCLLEFSDRPMLPTQLRTLERRLRLPLVAGQHPLLTALDAQLGEWFDGRRDRFEVPLVAPGTPFQERVWSVLRGIPSGTTISYEELAARSGRAGAQRAAGTANGANRLALLVPCHRVIRKTGETGNYGGGRWRKAWLLAHEREMADSGPDQRRLARSAFQATSTPTSSYFHATSTDAKPAAVSHAS
jgi:AraC family transcriptional regulator of adaptative response/methylated-DNA-[protein]-cysteine methyltransferase